MVRRTRIIRSVRPTALIYCEGAHDLAFMRHLKRLYSSASATKTNFSTTKGSGGSLDTLVADALKVPGDFNRYLVKLDNDRTKDEFDKANSLAEQVNANGGYLTITASYPCLDALLLSILRPGQDYTRKKSKTCKREFERDYLAADKRLNSAAYDRIFARQVLDEARKNIAELDDLIRFLEA